MPGYWIYQGSEYAKFLNMSGFWIYHGSEYTGITQACECGIISLDTSWICLVMTEYARMLNTNSTLLQRVSWRSEFAIFKKCAKKNLHYFHKTCYYVWEGCEYTCNSEYTNIVNMDLFLNMTGSWIYQGSDYTIILNISGSRICKGFEYVRVLNIPRLHRLLNVPEYPLIIPENAWLSLNISEYAWIYQHMHEILSYMPPIVTPCLLKSVVTYFNKVYSFKKHEVTILFSCRDFKFFQFFYNLRSHNSRINHTSISFLEFNTYLEPCFEIRWKKQRWQNWMAANFNIRKICSTVERMHGCKYFYRISYSTSERMHSWNQLFLQSKYYCWKNYSNKRVVSSPIKINTIPFKEWMTVILSVTKADALCQRVDGCN